MEYPFLYFYKLCHNRTRRWLFLVGIVAVTHLLFQSLLLPYGNALLSLLPDQDVPTNVKNDFPTVGSSTKSVMVRNPLTVNASDLIDPSVIVRLEGYADKVEAGGIGFDSGLIGNERIKEINSTWEGNGLHNTSEGYADKVEAGGIGFDSGLIGNERIKEIDSTLEGNGLHNISEHVVDGDVDNSYPTKEDGNERFKEMNFASEGKGFHNTSEQVVDKDVDNNYPTKEVIGMNGSLALVSIKNKGSGSILDNADKDMEHQIVEQQIVEQQIVKPILKVSLENNISLTAKKSEGDFHTSFQSSPLTSSPAALNDTTLLKTLTSGNSVSSGLASQESDMVNLGNHSATMTIPGIKKMRSEMPPKSRTSIHEMNHILLRHPRSMKPRRSSARDQEIVAVKKEIMHSPNAINDRELFAPLFRNVSMFKRSYELMERTLKVYVYRDGVKPIFHLPIMKGLYASEGWFMKLMEGNKQFVVKDPRRAHLFYMPFSSRMLEYTLYVRNSHNRTNLRLYLKDYSEKIAAKYPYWNRTDGADHFLVACHDWAPYETRHHMERCIKALCNADVTQGFKIGRDVSLPETYVRSARNPLRDLGGKPPSRRPILAFYAGSMHGYLRPILLKYWKDKDPDMKIFGPMPPGVASKMNYIHHMKSSKYCICPKGYEVNSPRIVEAIFYECVPVIISDNFVPPFFEVLNWEAFSLIIAEADIPRLKDILLSIPKEKYLELQLAVRKVQKHFLWHAKPMKYDLFHMTLHSIWYSRVLQTKLR